MIRKTRKCLHLMFSCIRGDRKNAKYENIVCYFLAKTEKMRQREKKWNAEVGNFNLKFFKENLKSCKSLGRVEKMFNL